MARRKARFVDFCGIKLSPRFLEAAASDPGIAIGFDPDAPYMQDYPWVFDQEGPIAPLHICVWNFYFEFIRPIRPGEIIHHKDGDPLNATVENLGIGSRSAHGLSHASRRQKFRPRKRWELFGWYRPQAEAKVRTLGFIEELAYQRELLEREARGQERLETIRAALESSRAFTAERAKKLGKKPSLPGDLPSLLSDRDSAENQLRAMLPALRAEIDPLDSGEKVPFTSTRPKRRDRLLGLKKIRRGCTPGEAALVRLLVKHGFDRDEAAQEAHLDRRIIDDLAKEPAVSLAIERWLAYRRLPPPSSSAKLKRFSR